MRKLEKLDKFKLFLECRGCLKEFVSGLYNQRGVQLSNWFSVTDKEDLILDAFNFKRTEYWFKIHDEWMEVLYG